jgi:DNA-binding transcriptional MerR regulator
MSSGALQIGELAARSGVSIDTVRYYEQRRLLARAPRTSGGFRLFPPETVERILFIKQAQEIGLTLDEIKDLLTGGGANECRRMSDLLRNKLRELDERIRTMQEFRQTLRRHLTACEKELNQRGEAARCPVLVEITQTTRARKAASRKQKEK